MSSVLELHQTAMEFADIAIIARHEGDNDRAKEYYYKALEREREAAQILTNDFDAEPTRSVLFRSAASMAMNCGELEEAKRLISTGLSGTPPQEIAEELRNLLNQISPQEGKEDFKEVLSHSVKSGALLKKNKEVLKELFSHSVRFGALLLAFYIFHTIVRGSSWPDEFKKSAEIIHLYASKVIIAIFALDLIINTLRLSFVMAVFRQIVHQKKKQGRLDLQNDEKSKIKNEG